MSIKYKEQAEWLYNKIARNLSETIPYLSHEEIKEYALREAKEIGDYSLIEAVKKL